MRYKKYLPKEDPGNLDSATAIKILQAARRLFLQNGFHATTTRDIATEAGVTLGLIPYYFKTKENLARKIAFDRVDQFYQQFDSTRMDTLSSAEKLYSLNLLIYQWIFSDSLFGNFLLELDATTDVMDDITTTFEKLSLQIIQSYRLEISDEECRLYTLAMIGSKKILIQKYRCKEICITYAQLTNLIISNYLYNLGLPDEEIARIIFAGQTFCNSIQKEREQHLLDFL